jgi:periplasmic divalent cation tolerance protein
MSDCIQISTTSDKKEILQTIANRLVESRLAACVQVGGPVHSVYRWQGRVEQASEWTCSIKTIAANLSAIESVVRNNHNYEEPQLIVTAIAGGSESYLDWVREQTRPAS